MLFKSRSDERSQQWLLTWGKDNIGYVVNVEKGFLAGELRNDGKLFTRNEPFKWKFIWKEHPGTRNALQ
jgi:hypothetical protein